MAVGVLCFQKFVPKHCTAFALSILSKIQTLALLELEIVFSGKGKLNPTGK